MKSDEHYKFKCNETRPSALGMSDPVMEFLEILETQEFQNHSQNFEEDKRDEGGKEDEEGECGKY